MNASRYVVKKLTHVIQNYSSAPTLDVRGFSFRERAVTHSRMRLFAFVVKTSKEEATGFSSRLSLNGKCPSENFVVCTRQFGDVMHNWKGQSYIS